MTEHNLKTWPEAFEAIWTHHKLFELRRDDRPFEVGDTLLLQEYNPQKAKHTGRWIRAEVMYVLRPGPFPGIEDGFCVMSIHPFDQGQSMCVKGT